MDSKNEQALGISIIALMISWVFKYIYGFIKELIMGKSVNEQNFKYFLKKNNFIKFPKKSKNNLILGVISIGILESGYRYLPWNGVPKVFLFDFN